ncbi:HlyD family secretion protein [Duganella sp. BJB488]|uniref:HlyD family secretion protein n=1 Tax=unclassified Duganella TaxID=2636909 RepID=UPI000E34D59B|nr:MULTISPECIES: HlyD family secretion protein [unclassified Duganella]RFP26114.1 HlyD family secretion protein [Duganella sp. BJB489]RFP28147.1 HlyD family secretion protein [Duganella sp. BJB488]RFP37042.1 HlyD family secretion protein [Duganella sp. BJB480]
MANTTPDNTSSSETRVAAVAAAAAAAAVAAAAPTAPAPDRRAQILSAIAFSFVALVGVLIVLYAWRLPPFSSAIVSTENALVRGQVTLIGTQLPGYVVDVRVQDFQQVKQGDLLVLIDDRIYQQRYEQAQAQLAAQKAALANWEQARRTAEAGVALNQATLANAEAQAAKSVADLSRVNSLAADGSLSVREQDSSKAAKAQTAAAVSQARASLEIAKQQVQTVVVNKLSLEAAVANATAALNAAKVDLDNTRITAPEDGQLGQVTVRKGAYVNTGAQLMGLVPRQLWVIANLKETQMNGVQVGQSATFKVDALDGALLTGQVERISPATGSEFSVLPADNATGNYVKIAQRIPVRIRIDPGQAKARRLAPGMSVVVSIDTSAVLDDAGAAPAKHAGAKP